jgi:hypothetical protein
VFSHQNQKRGLLLAVYWVLMQEQAQALRQPGRKQVQVAAGLFYQALEYAKTFS